MKKTSHTPVLAQDVLLTMHSRNPCPSCGGHEWLSMQSPYEGSGDLFLEVLDEIDIGEEGEVPWVDVANGTNLFAGHLVDVCVDCSTLLSVGDSNK